jgi:hypothetical protein
MCALHVRAHLLRTSVKFIIGDIYNRTREVIVWLGPEANGSNRVIEKLVELARIICHHYKRPVRITAFQSFRLIGECYVHRKMGEVPFHLTRLSLKGEIFRIVQLFGASRDCFRLWVMLLLLNKSNT